MNKKYTLKELAEIYMGGLMPESAYTNTVRAGIQKVLDAIGYKFPKDEERESFERWQTTVGWDLRDSTFEAWKAGREELRRDQMLAKEPGETKTEPAWIPWKGGECPLPDTVKEWEGMMRNGIIGKAFGNGLGTNWTHTGHPLDIVAYRVLEG